ncbi:hypothetical protein DESPIG_02735 [Desulfovibrio piger ATCC 29098]|uniref:Uncharacterized protein n=1 Tax=Desulfovibrio piger ATCC 29098 TaxID=411464 RepID=B6WXA9_9BACT|nr:hypothetical protein DESPIG_02735 [Desulfovibrio piger ATCC 29098]
MKEGVFGPLPFFALGGGAARRDRRETACTGEARTPPAGMGRNAVIPLGKGMYITF